MLYFDYSATTPVNEAILNEFSKYGETKYTDLLGAQEKEKLKTLLKTNMEVNYTSGSTESNNTAICGILNKYKEKGYHIITTKLEHSSINECLSYYEKKGFIIDYVNLIDGVVDINHLKELITKKTILVTIASVNSETGLLQPIQEIGKVLNKKNITFHSDMTQSIGKVNIDFSTCDMISFTSHKFFGLKGIGVLLTKKDLELIPILYGTRTYNYALIKSFTKALELQFENKNQYEYVKKINIYLKEKIKNLKNENITINSNDNCIPHILNISIKNYKPETFLHRLEMDDILISTKSACSSTNDYSKAVYALTSDLERAKTSVRISLSYLTTQQDIDKLISSIEVIINE